MILDLHFLVTALLGIVCGILGWLGRALWAAVDALRQDLKDVEIKMSAEYIRYDRLQDALKPIMDSLQEIKTTLTHKVDKRD
jgi:cell division protein FtsB